MGDALMKINEPYDAVTAYQKSFELNPADDDIVRVIGHCLSLTYDYQKAIQYYENALSKNPTRNDLVVDLGKYIIIIIYSLYIRINNQQKAEQLLQWERFLTDDFAAPTIATLRANS